MQTRFMDSLAKFHFGSIFVFALLAVLFVSPPPTGAETAAGELSEYPLYSGMCVSTADPFSKPTGTAYLLTFPPSVTALFGVSIRERVSFVAFVGGTGIPTQGWGALISGIAKVHIARPDTDHWGIAGQVQWIGGGAVAQGEEIAAIGGAVSAAQLIASSPIQRFRTHFGLALHTLPGYESEVLRTTIMASAEQRVGDRGSVFLEWIWGAVGADDGYDSAMLLLAGTQLRRGNTYYKLVIGVLSTRVGTGYETFVPVPPVLAVSYVF